MSDPIRILILDRGFVYVCRCPDPQDAGFWLRVTDARCIRRWGTTKGLAELYGGPTSETVLEALVPEQVIPVRAILNTFVVEQETWEPHLSGSTVRKVGSSGRTGTRKPAGTT
jgi:hypothetical protein